jgi:uncharacterized membrane protein
MPPKRHAVHSRVILFPLGLLAFAPLFDLVRLVTRDPSWSSLSFFVAFVGAVAAAVIVLPEIVDGIALDRGRAGLSSLALRCTAVALFVVSVVLRLRSGALEFAALSFALVVAGAVAFAAGATSRPTSPSAVRRATAPVA